MGEFLDLVGPRRERAAEALHGRGVRERMMMINTVNSNSNNIVNTTANNNPNHT